MQSLLMVTLIKIGESAMIVIDSETGEYEKIEVMRNLG